MQTRCMLLALVGLFVGCAPKASFDLTISNQTQHPITVGVVKDGPPVERHLSGPDQWAVESPLESLPPWGHVIPPGRTMDSPAITGDFPQGSTAYLRIYRGQHPNSGLIAISAPSPDRAEVFLFPGHNEIVVREDTKGIQAERLRPARP